MGYPLWETQLHDVLQAAFPELHAIFTYYCGSSIAGSSSIASATRIGIMEFLAFAKDTEICNKEFKVENLTQQFYLANTQAVMKASSSAKVMTARSPYLHDLGVTSPPPPAIGCQGAEGSW